MLDVRIVIGIGRDCGGSVGGICDWYGDVGIDHLSIIILWN